MKLIFILKTCKIICRLFKCNKRLKKCFRFLRERCFKTLRNIISNNDKNIRSIVNVLRNSPSTPDVTNRDVLRVNVSKSNGNF